MLHILRTVYIVIYKPDFWSQKIALVHNYCWCYWCHLVMSHHFGQVIQGRCTLLKSVWTDFRGLECHIIMGTESGIHIGHITSKIQLMTYDSTDLLVGSFAGGGGGRRNSPTPNTHIFGVFVETESHKLLEELWEVALKFWWVALGDEEKDSHGMEVSVRRLPLRQLYCCDTQGPNISLQREGGGGKRK